ncbi:MAG: hypothetical protein ACK5UQ_01725 [Planctomycetota bacterium]
MRIRHASLLLPWLAHQAKSQVGAPPFVIPRQGLFVDLRADEVPTLANQLPSSALGRLLAEPDVAAVWQLGQERLQRMRARRQLVADAVAKLPQPNGEIERPGQGVDQLALETLLRVEWSDVRSFRFVGLMKEGRQVPIGAGVLRCPPKAEGRLTRQFEATAKVLADNPQLKAVADAKVEGFPAHVFTVADDSDADRWPGYEPLGVWMLHLPGTFAFGEGTPADCGTIGAAPAAPAGIGLAMNLQAYLGIMTRGFGGGMPQELTALGVDQLQTFDWRGRFVGEHVLEEFELAFADKPVGLAPALWGGSAPLPKQALPEGAMLQLRIAADLPKLLALAGEVGVALPPPVAEALPKALTGGIALGVSAPPKGGLVPRMAATFGVADAAALQDALKQFLPPDVKTKQVQLEGVDCTSLLLDDLPPALRPTWCLVDGQLHVAESPNSLRDLLRAQKTGAEAMAVGDAPVAAGADEPMPSVDVRADLAAAYAAFHGTWLPLYELAEAASPMASKALLPRKDLPEPAVVGKHLGSVRGVMRKTTKGYVLQFQGPVGGPLAASFAATYGPMLSASMHRDYRTEQKELQIAQHLATEVWPKFEAFHKANNRWPKDLAELFVDQKLAADALLIPGDTDAEEVAMPAGDARTVRSSFRYHPEAPMRVLEGNEENVLLSSVRVLGWQRISLTTKGEAKATYGGDLDSVQIELVEPPPPPPSAEEAK